MARKAEAGIDYFPMNTDIILNPKIKLVVAEFGSKTTWPVLLSLYCKIYREKGYWIDWYDEDSKLLFAQDECKIELSVVNELVNGCIRRSLFDKRVFDLFGVLTSDRIQENYFVAKSRNKEAIFIQEFAVKNEESEYVYKLFKNVNIIALSANIITKKVNISTQKKKEIIEVELEGEGDDGEKPKCTQEEIDFFKNFNTWIQTNTPRVNQLKQPFTIEEYLRIKKDFSRETITKILTAMQNRADLLKKYVSANLTFRNWASKEFDNEKGEIPLPARNGKLSGVVAAINQQQKSKSLNGN